MTRTTILLASLMALSFVSESARADDKIRASITVSDGCQLNGTIEADSLSVSTKLLGKMKVPVANIAQIIVTKTGAGPEAHVMTKANEAIRGQLLDGFEFTTEYGRFTIKPEDLQAMRALSPHPPTDPSKPK